MLQAVLFDLDGTLLPMDTTQFVREYLQAIAGTPAVEPARLIQALLAGTAAMVTDQDLARTNASVFWPAFRQQIPDSAGQLDAVFNAFYAGAYTRLVRFTRPSPQARQAVVAARDRGLRLVLATNPVFPLTAIRERMVWAGIADLPWEFVTGFETMHFCKPQVEYYREIATLLQLSPAECLMVGNDTVEDLAAAQTGMRVAIVTDCLINPTGDAYRSDWQGTLAELADWLAVV